MACRHEHTAYKYDCDGLPDPLELEYLECLDCGSWLSLGPSSDDDERAAVEMRAAELAADFDDFVSWDGLTSLGMCSPDAEHADIIERKIASGDMYPRDLTDYYAGHLARIIHDHDAEGT